MARQSSATTPRRPSDAQSRRDKGTQSRKAAAPARQPLTRHPLFPAIVALWFGALFGLGSLAIRPSLIEALVLKTKLDLIVPAASPPLGITARILLALALAVFGAAIGIMLGRLIGRPKKVITERSRKVGSAGIGKDKGGKDKGRRGAKFVEHDEAEDDDDSVGFAAPRRRALAVNEDYEEEYHREFAPLPGGAPQILDVTEFDFTGDAPAAPAAPVADAPAHVTPVPVTPAMVAAEPEPDTVPGALDLSGFLTASDAEAPPIRQVFNAGPPRDEHGAAAFDAAPVVAQHAETQIASVPPAERQPFALPPVEPAPAFAAPVDNPFAAPLATAAVAPPPVSAPRVEPVPQVESTGGMAHVDLINRLAETMRQRRAAAASALVAESFEAAVPDVPTAPAGQSPLGVFARPTAQTTEGPEAIARFEQDAPPFAPPANEAVPAEDETADDIVVPTVTLPAALRPLSFDEIGEDDDDEALSVILPPRHIAMTPAQPAAADDGDEPASVAEEAPATVEEPADSDDALEDGYSSLLDLSRPAIQRSGYVRIDEPEHATGEIEPAVQFPGLAPFAPPAAAAEPVQSFAPPPAANTAFANETAPAGFAAPADPFAPPTPAAVTPGNMRRFDAPAGNQFAGAAPASVNSNALDAEETERALRTALATLQRMSARG